MGFVHVKAEDGSLHLIHTSQIGLPASRPAQAVGDWTDVWLNASAEPETRASRWHLIDQPDHEANVRAQGGRG